LSRKASVKRANDKNGGDIIAKRLSIIVKCEGTDELDCKGELHPVPVNGVIRMFCDLHLEIFLKKGGF